MGPGFRKLYEQAVADGLSAVEAVEPVTEQDLARVPSLLQGYLRRAGAVGRPQVRNFRVHFRGEMRRNHESGWMPIQVEQHTFMGAKPARIFLVKASVFGIPFEALHRFIGPRATMQVRAASLFQVVDAKGPEMDQGETVTFFNDLCLLAPAALLEADLRWEELGGRALKGTFRHQGQEVSAALTFDGHGDLVNFVSEDRFQSADGKTYLSFPWSTPVQEYREVSGFRIMSKAEALWLEPGGPFPYARFELEDITYNVDRPVPAGVP